jgi:hypothetical protein
MTLLCFNCGRQIVVTSRQIAAGRNVPKEWSLYFNKWCAPYFSVFRECCHFTVFSAATDHNIN